MSFGGYEPACESLYDEAETKASAGRVGSGEPKVALEAGEPPEGSVVASAGNAPWYRRDNGWRLLTTGLGGQGELIRCETWAVVRELAGGPLAVLRWGWGLPDDETGADHV